MVSFDLFYAHLSVVGTEIAITYRCGFVIANG